MGAVISRCGRYRYELTRKIGKGGGEVCWVMLNPSTADAQIDDATIRKVCGFSKSWGYGHLRVVNLYAFRTTYAVEIKREEDPVGEKNWDYVRDAFLQADRIVVGWGRARKLPDLKAVQKVLSIARGRDLWCLGTCNDGMPVHPLMIGYDVPLRKWSGV